MLSSTKHRRASQTERAGELIATNHQTHGFANMGGVDSVVVSSQSHRREASVIRLSTYRAKSGLDPIALLVGGAVAISLQY